VAALPESITALIATLSKLPGVGPRSAERLALHLVQTDSAIVKQLADAMVHAREENKILVKPAARSQNQSPCSICEDSRRDSSLVCVVERAVDILSVEKSNTFRGKFHVLGGKISPLDGVEPENYELLIRETSQARADQRNRHRVGTDVEGDAKSNYLAKRLARSGLKISRIGFGLPAGSGLEFADELTLSRALESRRECREACHRFDLGKVLVDFDYSIAARKIAARSTKQLPDLQHFSWQFACAGTI